MTENTQDMAVRPSYSQIVEAIPDREVHALLKRAEMDAELMAQAHERIVNDGDLSDEAKARKTQEAADLYTPRITDARRQARERVVKGAESAYRFSIPMPDGRVVAANTTIDDPAELVARQNATNAILNEVEAAEAKATMGGKVKPEGDPKMHTLKRAYATALAQGGLEGKVNAMAAVEAAKALGVDLEALVEDSRSDIHNRRLDEARRYEMATGVLPSGKVLPGGPMFAKTPGHTSGGAKPSGSPFAPKRRKPAWK